MLINSFTFHKYKICILKIGGIAKIEDFHKINKHPLYKKPKGPHHGEVVGPLGYVKHFIFR